MNLLTHQSLETFVALADCGTLVQAGQIVCRSTSAVSLQISALEQRLGRQLFLRSAQGMQLTPAGDVLLGHARRLLEIEAIAAAEVSAMGLSGDVRFGMPQDFAASRLAETLTNFRHSQPGVKVTAVIERNGVIASLVKQGGLDLAMLISRRPPPQAMASVRRRSHWYAAPRFEWNTKRPLPLVLLDGPCIYREDALKALERVGLRWEIAFSTGSVTAMWAAVIAGVGVTVRMDLGSPPEVRCMDKPLSLPGMPPTMISLVRPGVSGGDAVSALAKLVRESLVHPE